MNSLDYGDLPPLSTQPPQSSNELEHSKTDLKHPSSLPLTRKAPPSSFLLPPLLLAGLILLIAALHFAAQWHLPMPVCGLRTLTGVPCPMCGSTRCLLASSNFEIMEAFRFNPLTFLALAAAVAWVLLWAGETILKRKWSVAILRYFQSKPAKLIFTALVLINWIYLCLTLPR